MPIAEDGSRVNANFYSKLGPGIYRGSDGQLHRMPPPSRLVQQAARRFADLQSERLASVGQSRQIIATVTAVAAGNAEDGNATVVVTWRGDTYEAAGYFSTYTPAVGHRVKCSLIGDQLIVEDRIIGYPIES